MQRYRIILRDHLHLGRDRDVTFTDLDAAQGLVNSLPRDGTTCVYCVSSYVEAPYRVLVACERYVVWADRDRRAETERHLLNAGLNTFSTI